MGRFADPGLVDPEVGDVVEVGPGLAVGPVLDVRRSSRVFADLASSDWAVPH